MTFHSSASGSVARPDVDRMAHWISQTGRAENYRGGSRYPRLCFVLRSAFGVPCTRAPRATTDRPPAADFPNDVNGRMGWTKVSRIQHTPIADATSLQATTDRPPAADFPGMFAGWTIDCRSHCIQETILDTHLNPAGFGNPSLARQILDTHLLLGVGSGSPALRIRVYTDGVEGR